MPFLGMFKHLAHIRALRSPRWLYFQSSQFLRGNDYLILTTKSRRTRRGTKKCEGSAKALGVSQPRLNALLKGQIADFSLDALVNMLARAGMQVKMTVRKAA